MRALNRFGQTLSGVSINIGKKHKKGMIMRAASVGPEAIRTGNRIIKSPNTYVTLGAAAFGTIAAAPKVWNKTNDFRSGLNKGMFPGSTTPMSSGKFGIRSNTTPAGIGGVRFNFRRK